LISAFVYAQTSPPAERSEGVTLYQNGDTLGAIKVLKAAVKRNKADLSAWHYLGLALERQGKTNDARNAHEKAAKVGEELLEARFLKVKIHSSFEDLHEPLLQAAESAERYIALSSKLSPSKREEWNDRVEYLREYAANAESGERQIFSAKEVTTKMRVLSKPEPEYTEEAREHQVTGTIVLRAVFTAGGKVRGIVPLNALPDGLTRMAMAAARKIRFVPAMKDGKPVSMYLQIEYSFNLY